MMPRVLVDSNVLLDVIKSDPVWSGWSADALARHLDRGALVINPVIYAEIAFDFDAIEAVDELLPAADFGLRMTLLTRDARRYRSYFPALNLAAPPAS